MRKLRKTTSILPAILACVVLGNCSNLERGGISSGGDHPNPDGSDKTKSTKTTDNTATDSASTPFGSFSNDLDHFHKYQPSSADGESLPICQTAAQAGICTIYADTVVIKSSTGRLASKQLQFTTRLTLLDSVVGAVLQVGKSEKSAISSLDTPWCQYKQSEDSVWQVTSLSGELAEFVTVNCGPTDAR